MDVGFRKKEDAVPPKGDRSDIRRTASCVSWVPSPKQEVDQLTVRNCSWGPSDYWEQ